MKATISAIIPVGEDVRILHLQPEEDFQFVAGQYVEVSFNGLPARPYSIANATYAGWLEIHIRRGKGKASLYAMSQLKTQDEVELSTSQGISVYDPVDERPILAIGGGLGFTPLKSIVEEALYRRHAAPIYLFWGTENTDEQYMASYFEGLAEDHEQFHFTPITTQPVGQAAADHFDLIKSFRIFVAGSPEMIAYTIEKLEEKGVSTDNISYDRHPEARGHEPVAADKK